MSNPNITVPIKEIDSEIKDSPLTKEISYCFEKAYSSFISKKSNEEETNKIIKELGELLTISQENLEKVKNQKWFKRAWHTVTGKNKKLERINNSNLIKVQKGALFFLQNLAETNEQMMETVAFTLQRIEDIQIENSKLKGYLIKIVQKYNAKINLIENKLNEHDKVIRVFQHNSQSYIYLLFGIITLFISLISILFLSTSYKWLASIVLFFFSIILFIIFFRKNYFSDINLSTQTLKKSDSVNENDKYFPEIRDLIFNKYYGFVNDNLKLVPYHHFFEKKEKLSKLYSVVNIEEIHESKNSQIVKEILEVQPETLDRIDNHIKDCSKRFCDYHHKFIESICENFFPSSVGLDVMACIDFNYQKILANKLMNAILPYSFQFEQILNTRKILLDKFRKFQELTNESKIKKFLKKLLDESSDDDKFLNQFRDSLLSYKANWDNLAFIIYHSIIQINVNTYEESIRNCVNKIQLLFDEFNNQNISVLPLLTKLKKKESTNSK